MQVLAVEGVNHLQGIKKIYFLLIPYILLKSSVFCLLPAFFAPFEYRARC